MTTATITKTSPCPDWCEAEQVTVEEWEDQTHLHFKAFGDRIEAWAEIDLDGRVIASGFDLDVDTADYPEDMEAIAGWCLAAAAFMRSIQSSEATISA